VLARTDGMVARLAVALLALACLLYPVLALVAGRPLAQAEWFALAPDPTMLAALALSLLLLPDAGQGLRHPRRTWALLSLLPLGWCAITGATLRALGAPDWWLMPLAALVVSGVGGWQAVRPRPLAHRRPDTP
jgi:hypothetical protein